jgi:hypothetical protein
VLLDLAGHVHDQPLAMRKLVDPCTASEPRECLLTCCLQEGADQARSAVMMFSTPLPDHDVRVPVAGGLGSQ